MWHWLINATLLCSCLLWPAMWFIGMGAFSLLTLVSLLLLVSLLILTLFLQFQQQRRGYVFLVLVWLLNLFGLFWFYAFIEGLAPYSWWSYHIFHFTSVFEAVVFAITLSFKMRKDQFRRWQLEQQFDNEVDKQVQAQTVELTKLNSNLSKLALHDSLTHVRNRGSLDQTLQTLVAAQTPFSLILFDIDDFKGVNDRHGHLVGDMCLKHLCHSISQHVRDESLFRYGGEEFVILLPNVELTQAVDIAERVRLAVVSQLIIFDQSELQLTISLGVAQQRAGEESFAKVINDADVALYKAKKAGKNRTMMNEPE